MILFKGVTLVLPEGIRNGDLLVENGKIKAIGPSLPEHAQTIIKDKGLTLMAGVIDPHVHFRDPGAPHKEDLESGSMAAAAGGVTSFFDMPNTNPPAVTTATIAQKKAIAAQKSLVNYNFYIGATQDNLEDLLQTPNVPGIKLFVGSTTGNMLVDDPDILDRIFRTGSRLIAVHSEDEPTVLANKARYEGSTNPADHANIRSPEAALICTQKLVALAEKYQRRLHICHLTTEEEARYLAQHKPPFVTTELCLQHGFLHGPEIYEKYGCFAQINPPLRDKRHGETLWQALVNGVIDCVATDHAPHTIEEKQKPFGQAPSGMPGVETSLPLLLTQVAQHRCSLEQASRWLSAKPAELFKIHNKGELRVGFDADLALVDLNATYKIEAKNLHSKCGWTAFEDWTVTGKPIATVVNGHFVYREGDFFKDQKGQEIIIKE
ncbi:MAG: dihydroorotase [Candidatus Margulisiibacteriota bacterium]